MPNKSIFDSNALEQANKAAQERMMPYRQAREQTYEEHLKTVRLVGETRPPTTTPNRTGSNSND